MTSIQGQCPVELGGLPVGVFSHQAVRADPLGAQSRHFLFEKTLTLFQIGASPRERERWWFTGGEHCLVDECSPALSINSQAWLREPCPCSLKSSPCKTF